MIENGRNINRIQVGKSFEAIFRDYFVPFHHPVCANDWMHPAPDFSRDERHNESCQTSESQALFRPRQYLTKVSIFHYTDATRPLFNLPLSPSSPVISWTGTSHGEKSLPERFALLLTRPPTGSRIIDPFYFISTRWKLCKSEGNAVTPDTWCSLPRLTFPVSGLAYFTVKQCWIMIGYNVCLIPPGAFDIVILTIF